MAEKRHHVYTPHEALAHFLDGLRLTNPGPEVLAIADELQAGIIHRIALPRLVGGAERATMLLDAHSVPADLQGLEVIVGCRELRSASPSFAKELVREVLQSRQADRLQLLSPPPHFADDVREAADRLGVAERVVITPRAEDVTPHVSAAAETIEGKPLRRPGVAAVLQALRHPQNRRR